jgi:uncharacterized protein
MNATPMLQATDFETLDNILDDLRTRNHEVPTWEFCEGFVTAIACMQKPVPSSDAIEALLMPALPEQADDSEVQNNGQTISWANDAQKQLFTELWQRRLQEILHHLSQPVESLEDEQALSPEVMDIKGSIAALPEDQRQAWAKDNGDDFLPSLAQLWALGFLFATDVWADQWQVLDDEEMAESLADALSCIADLTEDDTDLPTVSMLGDDAPPSISQERVNAFGEAIWAVYDLYEMRCTMHSRTQ